MSRRCLVVGISGASGIVYGIRALQHLRAANIETHLVMSRSAQVTRNQETELKVAAIAALADRVYAQADIGAAISSGSFRTMGMIVAPCSMRTLGEIAAAVGSSLLTRAADVGLKERRRLVLMVRETPLHLGHLRAMVAVTEMDAIVYPPVPAFYTRPASLDDLVDQTVGRAPGLGPSCAACQGVTAAAGPGQSAHKREPELFCVRRVAVFAVVVPRPVGKRRLRHLACSSSGETDGLA